MRSFFSILVNWASAALVVCAAPACVQRAPSLAPFYDRLRAVPAAGDNPTVPREVGFSFDFRTRTAAERFVVEMRARGFRAELLPEPERGVWQAETMRQVAPTPEHLAREVAAINLVAEAQGGRFAALGYPFARN